MNKKQTLIFLLAVFMLTMLFLLSIVVATYIMTAASSVPVTVNPYNPWSWGPGWNP
jgi:hypothetical protein